MCALVRDHACEGQDKAEAVHPGETCAIHHPDGDRAQRGARRRRPGPSLSSRKGVDTDHDEDAADQRERSRLQESDTDDAKPCGEGDEIPGRLPVEMMLDTREKVPMHRRGEDAMSGQRDGRIHEGGLVGRGGRITGQEREVDADSQAR